MYKDGKAQRDKDGNITKAASFQSRDIPNARIEPNRKWFTNTRVVSQDTLTAFREAMAEKAKDPYQVLLKTNKLPMSLIHDGGKDTTNGVKQHKAKMTIETSPFAGVFGPKAQRKRVKLGVSTVADLADDTEKSMDTYEERMEHNRLLSGNYGNDGETEKALTMAIEPVFDKGQSKRIWNELYKVIDSSDVIIHVLDARDPVGTRCRSVEKYLKDEAPHKHLIFVLNKCDLVPTSVCVSNWLHLFLFLFNLVSPSWLRAPNESCQDTSHTLRGGPSVTTLGDPLPSRLSQLRLQADRCRFGYLSREGCASDELKPSLAFTGIQRSFVVMTHTFFH